MRAVNPFAFGRDVAKGVYFADRDAEKQKLTNDLKSGHRIVVFSARRYGKTALIVNVLESLAKEGYQTAYIDVSTTPDKSLFISKYRSVFIKAGTKEWFLDWVKRNLPKIKVSLGEAEIDLSGLSNRDVNGVFERILDLPQQLVAKKKSRTIVAFDEFHEIRNLDSKSAENLMRSKFQFHDRVSYIFSGSKAHILQDMFESPGKPFYKSALMFELRKIPQELYSDFIIRMFKKTGIKISEQIVTDILTRTDMHTYYTQQLCHEIWDICRVSTRSVVEERDVDVGIKNVISHQSAVYEKIWESLAPGYRKVIIGIMKVGGHQIWSKDFRSKNRVSVGAIDKAIQHLTDEYLIEKDEQGNFVIPDPFLRGWLAARI